MTETTAVRRVVPLVLMPLALIGCALANAPWLRAFPAGVIGVPLFGAAVLSVLAPLVVVGIGVRRLWLTALIDIALFVFYELLVTLRKPVGFASLYDGLVHGPAKILSFALPLVGPRTLLVAPVALCWLGGAILGECLARGWQTVVPHITLIGVFGLAYGGSVRAVSSAADGRRYDTVLAVALLVTLLLLRAAGAWVLQDESAEATQPGGLLPLRGLAIGVVSALVLGLGAAGLGHTSVFDGPPHMPARQAPLDQSDPLTPLSFVAGLRPANPKSKGAPVFTLVTDSPGSAYVPIADVDTYDGDGWSFTRTFRPSGGVMPADVDPRLRPKGRSTGQQYTIVGQDLTRTPWMPYLYRPQRVSGVDVDVDASSGMVVPAQRLRVGESYTVQSQVASAPFSTLPASSVQAGYAPAYQQLPTGSVKKALADLVSSLSVETRSQPASVITFLQTVASTFQDSFGLAGAAGSSTPSASPSPSPSASTSVTASSPGGSSTPTAVRTPSDAQRAGGTSFADVLASIRQFRSATPEQYATLMCLIAREIGVPARVATGFRIGRGPATGSLPAGRYQVTTAQAWTWVEIPIAGRGWVVLDPSPTAYSASRKPPESGSTPSPTPALSSSANASISTGPAGPPPAPPSEIPGDSGTSALAIVLIVVAVVLALLVLALVFLLLRKRWRATRRRRGTPREQLLGAWRETLDMLEEAGLEPLRAATSREVGQRTQQHFGAEPALAARQLGDAANKAIFSPGAPVEQDDADAAWATQAVLARSVRRTLGRRDRVRSALRYHRPRSDHPDAGPESWAGSARDSDTAPSRRRPPLHR